MGLGSGWRWCYGQAAGAGHRAVAEGRLGRRWQAWFKQCLTRVSAAPRPAAHPPNPPAIETLARPPPPAARRRTARPTTWPRRRSACGTRRSASTPTSTSPPSPSCSRRCAWQGPRAVCMGGVGVRRAGCGGAGAPCEPQAAWWQHALRRCRPSAPHIRLVAHLPTHPLHPTAPTHIAARRRTSCCACTSSSY